jgi:hypothetical protein
MSYMRVVLQSPILLEVLDGQDRAPGHVDRVRAEGLLSVRDGERHVGGGYVDVRVLIRESDNDMIAGN